MLVDSDERRALKNFYKMMMPVVNSQTDNKLLEDQKLHFERLGNLILIHINIAEDGSDTVHKYEAEWINGTSLEKTEKFDFDRPSCPKTFSDFKCFNYLEDTIMTTTRTTTTTPEPPATVRVPPQEIGFSNPFKLYDIIHMIYFI